MKKVLSLCAMLFVVLASWGQTHWTGAPTSGFSSTNIYFSLEIDGTDATANHVEIAAFIGGELRGVAEYKNEVPPVGGPGIDYGMLKVWGDNEDMDKPIEVRAFLNGLEYQFRDAFTFDAETWGYLSNLTQLYMNDVTAREIRLSDIEIEVGNDIDLMDNINLLDNTGMGIALNSLAAPCLSITSEKITWTPEETGYFTITGSMLKAEKSTTRLGVGLSGTITIDGIAPIAINQGKVLVTPFRLWDASISQISADPIRLNLESDDAKSLDMMSHVSITVLDPNADGMTTITKTWQELVYEGALPQGFNITVTPLAGGNAVRYNPEDKKLTAVSSTSSEGLQYNITADFGEFTKDCPVNVSVSPFIVGLVGIYFDNPTQNAPRDKEILIPVRLNPADATVSPENFVVSASATAMGENWVAAETSIEASEEGYTVKMTPRIAGSITLKVKYDDFETTTVVNGSAPFDAKNGWSWNTFYFLNSEKAINDFDATYYSSEIEDIRSITADNYKDPSYGFFGDLTTVNAGSCYKVKNNAAATTLDLYEGVPSSLNNATNITLKKGWNWIAYPYQYDRSFESLSAYFNAVEGDRIISHALGFAEYSNEWASSLSAMVHGQGFLYYTESARTITLPAESTLRQPATAGGKAVKAVKSPWTYDASQYRDNMTIIAEIKTAEELDNMSVGAFVGDECRGESKLVEVDGRHLLFITAFGKPGDKFTFSLYDPDTYMMYECQEQIPFDGNSHGTLSKLFELSFK